ncbi:Signal transduction histidine kinase [Chitinophaga sp. YR573]|uniref:hybrid sensor histidine kinase/response regulator n=1 Tax=Chitinophaga sp. YR573 TaxID=1881040 RepID=UPI0008B6EE94|nr:ATP-binding protein [Chitinophaga sp. YR573]SEW22174.1 Signal transduction histidine kinase [Chitinophaga sp. YR573]
MKKPQNKNAIIDLFRAGTDVLEESGKRTVVIIVNVMAIIPLLLAFIMGPILYVVTHKWEMWVYPWIEVVILSMVVILNKRHKFNSAGLLVFYTHSCGMFFFGLLIGPAACIEGISIFLVSLSFLIFSRRLYHIFGITALLLITASLEINYYYGIVDHVAYSASQSRIISAMIFFAVIILNVLVMNFYSTDFLEWISRVEKKNDSKSDFITKTSHDLRGSINVIESILNECFNPENNNQGEVMVQYKHLSNMYFALQDAKLVMNDVLSLRKMESGLYDEITRSPVEIREWFEKRASAYQTLGDSRSVKIECRISDDVPEYIVTDAAKLHRIIINLLTNAIKFTRDNTIVKIYAYAGPGMRLIVDITDEGDGIEEANIENIFNPYVSQAHQNTEATGLGLTISKYFADILGGSITVKSKPGTGSTFTLSIPMEKGASARIITPPEKDINKLLPMNVLVIDDDPMCRMIAERMLFKMVDEVMIADTLDKGLWLSEEKPPNVILLDLNMPGLSGKEMLHKIKSHASLSEVPVIICSSDAYEETITEIKLLGANGYIVKPISSFSQLYNEIIKFNHLTLS